MPASEPVLSSRTPSQPSRTPSIRLAMPTMRRVSAPTPCHERGIGGRRPDSTIRRRWPRDVYRDRIGRALGGETAREPAPPWPAAPKPPTTLDRLGDAWRATLVDNDARQQSPVTPGPVMNDWSILLHVPGTLSSRSRASTRRGDARHHQSLTMQARETPMTPPISVQVPKMKVVNPLQNASPESIPARRGARVAMTCLLSPPARRGSDLPMLPATRPVPTGSALATSAHHHLRRGAPDRTVPSERSGRYRGPPAWDHSEPAG